MTQISFGDSMFIDDSAINHHSELLDALVYLFIQK